MQVRNFDVNLRGISLSFHINYNLLSNLLLGLRLLKMDDLYSGGGSPGGSGGLYPPLFNVAPRAEISVNATCGQNGAEEYCKLVDAYPHRNWAKQCGTCNAHSSDRARQRSIQSLIWTGSGLEESWWQSPTLQGGRQFEYVTITLDLKQVSRSIEHPS